MSFVKSAVSVFAYKPGRLVFKLADKWKQDRDLKVPGTQNYR